MPESHANRVAGSPQPGHGEAADVVIDRIAARQHGVVARAQLVEAGVPVHVIEYRVKKRRLRPIHRGVYRVGPVAVRFSRELAAVLACGHTAVLSHQSAAGLWGIRPGPREGAGRPPSRCRSGRRAPVHVTVVDGYRTHGPGVRVHRVAELPGNETRVLRGIRTTSPARTLLDLASTVGERRLERAVAEAERRGLTHSEQLRTLLAAYPRRAGTRRLRNLIDRRAGPAFTRSELEDRVLALVRRAGLEPPEVNQVVEGFEVDLYWPDSRLAVEVDGFAYHSSPGVFESDRQRDSVLAAAGIRVMRVTWRQLDENPEALLVNLVRALSR